MGEEDSFSCLVEQLLYIPKEGAVAGGRDD